MGPINMAGLGVVTRSTVILKITVRSSIKKENVLLGTCRTGCRVLAPRGQRTVIEKGPSQPRDRLLEWATGFYQPWEYVSGGHYCKHTWPALEMVVFARSGVQMLCDLVCNSTHFTLTKGTLARFHPNNVVSLYIRNYK